MAYRPLAFVSGLTLGDYILWNWSLNAGHDLLALVSGLTLPPLGLVCLWLLALNLLRLIGNSARRKDREAIRRGSAAGGVAGARKSTAAANPEPASASASSPASSSGKLAA